MWYCLYTEDYIDSLVEWQRNNPTTQVIDRGQRKLLEEIFIVVVPLIFVFWAALQQGWVDLWLLLNKCRKNNDI
jgi:ABC-type sulfate transport system permease subunit